MMNPGTLISFFICIFPIGLVNNISAISVNNAIPNRHCTMFDEVLAKTGHDDEYNQRCTLAGTESKTNALQITVDQIVQHVSSLIEGRPNSKKNIAVHLAAIISSIINFVAKMAACQNKHRDSFYHGLNTKFQTVLTECVLENEMEEVKLENAEAY